MTLHLHENRDENDYNLWVDDVPFDFSDSDVKWNVEQLAKEGDRTAKRALSLLPSAWISMNGKKEEYRVYLDGMLPSVRR